MNGRMSPAIPRAAPAKTPFKMVGDLDDLKMKSRKRVMKNRLAVCDIMVEDMTRTQGEAAASNPAARPVLES